MDSESQPNNGIQEDELFYLATRISQHQAEKKLSDSKLYSSFVNIGSTKTYRRILARQFTEMNVPKQIENYRAVVAIIEASRDHIDFNREYDDFVGVLEVRRAFMSVVLQTSIARFVLVQGLEGTGKSGAHRALLRSMGKRVIGFEADETWNDRPIVLLRAINKALDLRDAVKEEKRVIPKEQNKALDFTIERLNAGRVALALDEGHHIGPRCINVIKTLINQTTSEVLLFAMASLWNLTESENWQVAKQLTKNRLFERITLGYYDSDVEKMLTRGFKWADDEMGASLELLKSYAPKNGNLGFVRDICARLLEHSGGEPVTHAQLREAVEGEFKKR